MHKQEHVLLNVHCYYSAIVATLRISNTFSIVYVYVYVCECIYIRIHTYIHV